MLAGDLPGFGNGGGFLPDPDLYDLDPSWEVTIEMIDVSVHQQHAVVTIHDNMERYAAVYRHRGPWGMPPIVMIRGSFTHRGDMLLTGNHRLVAATMAGLTHIPALIVHVHDDVEYELFND